MFITTINLFIKVFFIIGLGFIAKKVGTLIKSINIGIRIHYIIN